MGSWDGRTGTAGGADFGTRLAAVAAEREVTDEMLAGAAGLSVDELARVIEGTQRVGISALAALATALRLRPIEFMQRTGILSLEAYAFGLDPLYFLPEGPVRYDARIYMREINPRHPVPESDMTRRNLTLKAIAEDPQLDPKGKAELELTYLLHLATQELKDLP
jgi:transcriptional regulator with XRE-family HTH domain